MDFINNVEMASLVDAGMAETEIHKETIDGDTITTIYAGAPFHEARQNGENFSTVVVWKIRRTIVFESDKGTFISTQWAKGDWNKKESLNYNYL